MSHERTRSTTAIPTVDPREGRPTTKRRGPDDTAEPDGQFPGASHRHPDDPPDSNHEGATEEEVGDRTGPGAGYDQEPVQERDKGGVA